VTYLLDTDHLSILQRKSGAEYSRLAALMAAFTVNDFACSVVSLHEQLLGAHAFINQAKNSAGLVRGYELLARLPRDYAAFALLPFDAGSAGICDQLLIQKMRIGTMDLRLAATALSRGLIILTRNLRDFGRIAGLTAEDWTK
jgi:tRNA(fMet)-specific endonuclease VapC